MSFIKIAEEPKLEYRTHGYGLALPCGHEAQKKTPRVPICQDCPVRGVSLFDKPLVKKRVQQFRKGG